MLALTINAEPRKYPGQLSVADLVARLELDVRKVAVELNREIVPRSTYASVWLRSGDCLEIVHFIGGG